MPEYGDPAARQRARRRGPSRNRRGAGRLDAAEVLRRALTSAAGMRPPV